jgi:signal transduction histidine kinase/CHASE1-domain containing sensor protein
VSLKWWNSKRRSKYWKQIRISKLSHMPDHKGLRSIPREVYVLLFSIIFVPLWIYFLSPQVLKIPSDFNYTADVVSVDNFYDEVRGEYKGEQYSKTIFSYDVVSRDRNVLFIKNVFDVKSLDGFQIFRTEPVYTIDPVIGRHVDVAGEVVRSGHLFSPRGLKKGQSFEYWHVSNNVSSNMEYVGEEYIEGLKVYRYEKSNTDPVDQTEFMGFLPGVPETRGIKLASRLGMWVEPISGYPVRIDDSSLDYFYYDIATGERISSYNKFSNTYSEDSVSDHVSYAKSARSKVLATKYGTVVLLVFLMLYLYFSRLYFYRGFAEFIKTNRLATIIFFFCVAISGYVFLYIDESITGKNNEIFRDQSVEMKRLVLERVGVYENSLLGSRGLFDAIGEVDRDQWKQYVDSLNLQDRYPGIQGLGYTKVVSPDEKDNLISTIRSEGYPDFDIRPEGERSIYTSIIYLEPFDIRNQRAFGFDMFSEPTRRKAMVRARDNAEVAASGRVFLLQEGEGKVQSGFLFYLPVYRGGTVPETQNEREQNLIGYVYAPIRIGDFMRGIFGSHEYALDLHIYTGLNTELDNKVFDLEDGEEFDNRESKDEIYRDVNTIYIAGEPFTFEFINLKTYELSNYDRVTPYAFLFAGLTLSLLIFLVIYSNTQGRRKALSALEKANSDLGDTVKKLDDTKKAVMNVLEDVEAQKKEYEDISRRLTLATNSAHIGVWELDVSTNTMLWDQRMYEIYALKEGGSSSTYEAWHQSIHPDDRSANNEAMRASLKEGVDYSHKFRIVLPNSEVRYIQTYAVVDRDSLGNPLKMIGVNWDITKESVVDREKTEFVSLASHQLKTPIGAIQWNVEMLLDGDYGKVTRKQKEVLEETYKMSNRMNDLVNALLNISRIEMGVFIVEPTPTDFAKLCEEVITEMEPRRAKKGHELIKDFQEDLPQVPADEKLLRMVFQNFISNAIKYTKDRGKIKVSLKTDTENILVSVSNDGEPIPDAEQSRIFSKMFRASNAHEQDPDGNGLGLYLVKQIVENAGGKIWFRSRKGEDTVFACSFPLTGMKARAGTRKLS